MAKFEVFDLAKARNDAAVADINTVKAQEIKRQQSKDMLSEQIAQQSQKEGKYDPVGHANTLAQMGMYKEAAKVKLLQQKVKAGELNNVQGQLNNAKLGFGIMSDLGQAVKTNNGKGYEHLKGFAETIGLKNFLPEKYSKDAVDSAIGLSQKAMEKFGALQPVTDPATGKTIMVQPGTKGTIKPSGYGAPPSKGGITIDTKSGVIKFGGTSGMNQKAVDLTGKTPKPGATLPTGRGAVIAPLESGLRKDVQKVIVESTNALAQLNTMRKNIDPKSLTFGGKWKYAKADWEAYFSKDPSKLPKATRKTIERGVRMVATTMKNFIETMKINSGVAVSAQEFERNEAYLPTTGPLATFRGNPLNFIKGDNYVGLMTKLNSLEDYHKARLLRYAVMAENGIQTSEVNTKDDSHVTVNEKGGGKFTPKYRLTKKAAAFVKANPVLLDPTAPGYVPLDKMTRRMTKQWVALRTARYIREKNMSTGDASKQAVKDFSASFGHLFYTGKKKAK